MCGYLMKFEEIVGKWEHKVTGSLLNFYIDEQTGSPMLARYQFTPISLLAEQAPFVVTQETLDSFSLQDGCLMLDTQVLSKSSRALDISPEGNSALETFNTLVELFNQHYAFFELRNVNWPQLVEKYRPEIEKQDNDLFDTLSAMLAEIGDNHVMLAQSLNGEGKEYFGFKLNEVFQQKIEKAQALVELHAEEKSAISDYIDSLSKNAITQIKNNLLHSVEEAVEGKLIWGLLKDKPQTGYLNLASSDDIDIDELNLALDKAIALFNEQKITSMVIDARFNQGGDDDISLAVANRFSHEAKLISSVQTYYESGFLTPKQSVYFDIESSGEKIWNQNISVTLLTSPVTASAGEQFALAISALPQVKIIGEATMGILSDQFARKLPNGWWVTLSNELRFDHHDKLIEKVGVQPDIKADFPIAGSSEYIDPGISAALQDNSCMLLLEDVFKDHIKPLLFDAKITEPVASLKEAYCSVRQSSFDHTEDLQAVHPYFG